MVSVETRRVFPEMFRKVLKNPVHQYRLLIFLGVLCVYAFFGSPTPERFGFVEAVVGLGLIIYIGIKGALSFMSTYRGEPLMGSGHFLLMYGLTLPLVLGAFHAHDLNAMIRDVVPFFFMMAPVFLLSRFENLPHSFVYLVLGVIVIGLCFSIRSLDWLGLNDPLFYLANMPSVFFTCFLLFALATQNFIKHFSLQSLPLVFVFAALAAICFWAMAEVQQRASIGLFFGLYALLIAGFAYCYIKRTLVLIMLIGLAFIPFGAVFMKIVEAMIQKTALVGVNMRWEELLAVWHAVSEHPLSLMFGLGWGAHFYSPAVADIEVNFTHSLLSSMLLKAGLIGVFLSTGYIVFLFRILWKALPVYPVYALALAGPLCIDVFFYASYKSLDFGLIIFLIVALHSYARFSQGDFTPKH